MSQLYYMVIAAIRAVEKFFANSLLIKKITYYVTARTHGGITARLWTAVVVSVAALLLDFFYLGAEFQKLPAQVPLLFDVYGEIAVWGDKSELSGFAEARVAFFVIMALIGCVICKVKGGTLMAQRIRLLMVDIANLVITTGVAMAAVYIEIAKGGSNEKLAEEWEYAVMCFWLLTLVVEFITDKKYLGEVADK